MARNRASMREGPLAELFRATEAAQRQGQGKPEPQDEQQQLPTEEPPLSPPPATRAPERFEKEPPAPPPIRAVAPAPDPEPETERRIARWLDPLPEQPARLERAREHASYLAVIRVV